MLDNLEENRQVQEEEEEHVLLDLDDVCTVADIPANAPFVLSGLNTLNPVLEIGSLKLIGEYQETVGTCYLFSEKDGEMEVMPPETAASDRNLFKDRCIVASDQTPSKQVHPIASLQKILKFRIAKDDDTKISDDTTGDITKISDDTTGDTVVIQPTQPRQLARTRTKQRPSWLKDFV